MKRKFLMYEHHSEPVISRAQWLLRMFHSARLALGTIGVSLLIGITGYHLLGNLGWVDALLEASMILGGMGPVAVMDNDAVKIFASFYALFSGLMLVAVAGILLAPFLHRLMHHFHAKNK
jgi:hypothetical protein